MVRVPNTISFRSLGLMPDDDPGPPPPLHTMSAREVRHFIRRCERALRSHSRDFLVGHDKDNALAAFESVMGLLLEIREVYPDHRADIDRILIENGYPVPQN